MSVVKAVSLLLCLCSLSQVIASPKTVTLNNGVVMPLVSAGVWKYNGSQAQESCEAAYEVGFRGFDTAYDYDNQEEVGAAFKMALQNSSRSELFLTTKVPGCGTIPLKGLPAPSKKNCGPDTLKIAEGNLVKLDQPYVDLMLLHFPPDSCGGLLHTDACTLMQEQWGAFEELYALNKSRAIGVSNYCQSCFECILKTAKIIPAVNQVQYHVGEGDDPIGLHSYCKSKGITMEAYSAMAQGSKELITGNLTTSIGKAHGKSGAQVALKWVIQKGVPLVTKASNPAYLAEDIDLFDFDLTAAEMALLDASNTPKGKPSFFCSS